MVAADGGTVSAGLLLPHLQCQAQPGLQCGPGDLAQVLTRLIMVCLRQPANALQAA